MSNDPAPGGEQPGWQGQQPYPGSYGQHGQHGQHGEQAGYPGAYAPGQQGGYGQAPPPWAAPGPAQQRSGYPGSPPPGPAGVGPGGASDGTPQSFFGSLFDFNFNAFATPVVIKVLYILGLLVIAGVYLVYVGLGFYSGGAVIGLVVLLLGGVGALFSVMMLRTTLEFYYALVRMSEDIRAMRSRG